jgi:hypothetical protein
MAIGSQYTGGHWAPQHPLDVLDQAKKKKYKLSIRLHFLLLVQKHGTRVPRAHSKTLWNSIRCTYNTMTKQLNNSMESDDTYLRIWPCMHTWLQSLKLVPVLTFPSRKKNLKLATLMSHYINMYHGDLQQL